MGSGSARVLIRLPDLRPQQKRSLWQQVLGFALTAAGGGNLSAASNTTTSGDKRLPNTALAGESSDTATAARWRAIFQWLEPLLNYMVTHPKTIVSGALAAAAQFAAMVAWQHSGQTDTPYAGVEKNRVVISDEEPPTWCPAPRFQADRRGNSVGPVDYGQELDPGPQIIDPRSRHSREYRYRDQERRDRDWDRSPHAALNRASRLTDCDRHDSESLTDDQPDGEADPTAQHVALRHGSPQAEPATALGVARLRGNIIPAPTREASHEPAQPRVH